MLISVHIYEIFFMIQPNRSLSKEQIKVFYGCDETSTFMSATCLIPDRHQECLKWSEIVWTICCCTSVGSLQTKNIKQQTCQVCIFKTDEACPELTLTDKVYIVYQVFEQKVQDFLELFKEKRTLDVLYEVLNPSFPIISHLQDI